MWVLLFDVCLVLGSDVSSETTGTTKRIHIGRRQSHTIRKEAHDDKNIHETTMKNPLGHQVSGQ